MKPIITLSILLAAAYVVARPSATPSPVVAPTTPVAPVETSNVSDTPTVDEAEPGVVWFTDYSTAFKQAIADRKLLLVHLRTEGCAPCDMMERWFNRKEVIRELSRYVLVKSDCQRPINPGSKQSFAGYLGSRSYPFEAVIDPVRNKQLWRGNPPFSLAPYLKHLRSHEKSVVVPTVEQPKNRVGNIHNPLCRCSPCLCGSDCQCGKDQVPVAKPAPVRTYRRVRACRSCR